MLMLKHSSIMSLKLHQCSKAWEAQVISSQRSLGSDSVALRPKVMVSVGDTPGDSSPPDTVCKDAGYPKVSVSLEGLDVVSVYPLSSVTPPHIRLVHTASLS